MYTLICCVYVCVDVNVYNMLSPFLLCVYMTFLTEEYISNYIIFYLYELVYMLSFSFGDRKNNQMASCKKKKNYMQRLSSKMDMTKL